MAEARVAERVVALLVLLGVLCGWIVAGAIVLILLLAGR